MKARHVVVLILALALALLVLGCAAALAADGTKRVGLVIAFPDGTQHVEVVTVPMTATTYEALQRAAVDMVGTNGQFGLAVCSINKTGCPASNCFCDSKHFWAFYHLDPAANQWVVSDQGVGAAVPADGAVEGFAWSAMDAKFNPVTQPPVLTLAQIQAQAQPTASAVSQATPLATAAGAASATAANPAPPGLPTTGGGTGGWGLALVVALLVAGIVLNRMAVKRKA